MTEAEKLQRCAGCRDDFYNDRNPYGIKRCWNLETATLVTAYRIGTWTVPTQPGAFTKVEKLKCWNGEGVHFYNELPPFVHPDEVNKETP